jgi:hypothetical protein
MVLLQLFLVSPGSAANPIVIQTGLYGKYKVRMLSAWFSNIQGGGDTTTQAVQFRSRQFILPFPGPQQGGGNIGAYNNHSVRYPVILTQSANQINNGYGSLDWYADFDGTIELLLWDMVSQQPATVGECIISLDVEPVDTPLQKDMNLMNPTLAHTFTQLPVITYSK